MNTPLLSLAMIATTVRGSTPLERIRALNRSHEELLELARIASEYGNEDWRDLLEAEAERVAVAARVWAARQASNEQ